MYVEDTPIKFKKDDQLGRTLFVTRLTETILAIKDIQSLVIGLYGPWGSGKSSILNLLKEKLDQPQKGNNSIQVMQFDPWFFNSEEELIKSFISLILSEVQDVVGDKKVKRELRSLLRKYFKHLTFNITPNISFLGGLISIGAGVSGKRSQETVLSDLREKIESIFRSVDSKFIILIDNIDRLDSKDLLLVLKLVRLCSDFPNFIYILAFDQKQVINILSNIENIDPAYLNKIIQVDIHLPKIEQSTIDNYVGMAIDSIAETNKINFESNISERFGPLYQDLINKIIKDFRTAKRYLNAIEFSMPIIKGEINYADFLALEVVRVFFPIIYQGLQKFKYELTALDTQPLGEWRMRERKSSFDELEEWIEACSTQNENRWNNKDSNSKLIGLLRMMFPSFDSYKNNPQNPILFDQYKIQELKKDQRICLRSNFDRYFRLSISSNEISTVDVKEFIQAINSSSWADQKDILSTFQKYKNSDLYIQYIRKLGLYADGLTGEGKSLLKDIFLELIPSLSWGRNGGFLSEARVSLRFILDNLVDRSNSDALSTDIVELILNSPSLSFAAAITEDSKSISNHSKMPQEINYDSIKNAFKGRLQNEIDNEFDLFSEYPDSFNIIIRVWKSPEILNQSEEANKFVYEQLSKNPNDIPIFLSINVWTEGWTREPKEFGYSDLIKNYNPGEIYAIINKVRNIETSSPIEKFALEEFVRIYEKEEN